MRLSDTKNGYGWISIAFHWVTAIAVLVIWFVGSSIRVTEPAGYRSTLDLHTSLAVSAYGLLWGRIIWRLVRGHPGPLPKQRGFFFALGKYVHYGLMAAMVVMLVSGPLMVWSRGAGIHIFDWFVLPSPIAARPAIADIAYTMHAWGGMTIILGALLHIAGVFKHIAVNRDGTFDKMMIAAEAERNE